MQSINISQPDRPKHFVDEPLETMLLAGLNSPASELTEDDWAAIRQEAMAALEARRKAR